MIGCSIYGGFVIDGSLYSRFYSISKPVSIKVPREITYPEAEFPNNAIYSCMPTNNLPESPQPDKDEEIANGEGIWTCVKRKKPRDSACVPKRLLKLRAPQHMWENMSSSENEVDSAAAPVHV